MDNYNQIPVAYATPLPPPVAPGSLKASASQNKSFKVPPASSLIGNEDITEEQISQLVSQGYSRGLAKAIGASNVTFPLRFWVVDNSGSMAKTDGHRFVETKNRSDVKMVSCTRWKEIQETVEYHAQMAALLKAPTVFRLLNPPGARIGPQEFGVANKGEEMISSDLQVAMNTILNAYPAGCTPLTRHIYDIREQIVLLAPQLQSEGRKVVIVLATDGLPTDESGISNQQQKDVFTGALKSLEGLPVWIVVRLCTDQESVVEFYNDLDSQLELSVEVLDDFVGEAEEIYSLNKWLNYTLPLHRMREMGFQNRLFDMLDERALTKGELRDFCMLLFGREHFDGVPDPEADFTEFLRSLSRLNRKEPKQWNPIKKKMMPLVDLEKMNSVYGSGSCIIS